MSAFHADALVRWLDQFADQGVFTTDCQLVVTSWNRWLERHTGRPASAAVGRPLLELYPDLAARGLDERYREALSGHASIVSHLLHRYLLPIETHLGEHVFTTMPQRARIAPLTTDDRVVGTVTVIDDVSERVAAEAELRRQIDAQRLARNAAENALRVKDEFLATLSHEIRTPLNAVLGWASILTERELDAELRARALSSISRNAMLQARMIDDLLDTARIMAGKLRLQMQPVDLAAVATAATDGMTPVLESKRIALRSVLDAPDARVLGDPDRLQQIIWNLLSNAAKFTDVDGAIEVRLERAAESARITVADNGKGIEPEFLPYVFDRFRQADASSSRREGGLGLGLALVRELVELHGGWVRASSPGVGKGSVFVVELPTIPPSEAGGQPRAAGLRRAAPGALDGVRALVVDDEADARELIAAILADAGARVSLAASCQEALDRMRAADAGTQPDVILADIGMSPHDGYHLIREVRRLPADRGGAVPAVAVTAYVGSEVRLRVLSAGYQLHVTKPVNGDALVAAVSSVVRRVDA